ncbi:MAG: alpha-1,6-glucosidase domain-containing protein, partial [Acidobacteriota bacterium]|nr:alpha-1,6-glucosidase domain-containing protein [Acidobacteriota bacterium]
TDPVEIAAPDLPVRRFKLHRLQRSSVDPVVRDADWDRHTDTFSVPARTAAVFVGKPDRGHGD